MSPNSRRPLSNSIKKEKGVVKKLVNSENKMEEDSLDYFGLSITNKDLSKLLDEKNSKVASETNIVYPN